MKISWAVLLRRIAFPTRSKASSFVIHPSGALTVFVLRDDHGDQLYALDLVRLSPDGEAVASTAFEEIPGPRENLFYDPDGGVHELPIDGPFKLGFNGHAVGVAGSDASDFRGV